MRERAFHERVARNNRLFRQANEAIKRRADEHAVTESLPFICECANEDCTQIVQLPAAEYERIREHPRRFLVRPGHEAAEGPAAVVVEEREGYAVLEKVAEAGEMLSGE